MLRGLPGNVLGRMMCLPTILGDLEFRLVLPQVVKALVLNPRPHIQYVLLSETAGVVDWDEALI